MKTTNAHKGKWIFLSLCGLLLGILSSAAAANQAIILEENQPVRDLRPYIMVYFDPSHEMTLSDIRALPVNNFTPVTTKEPSFSHTTDAIWLRIPVKSASKDITQKVLVLETNFMFELGVILANDSREERLLSQSIASPFSTRDIPHPNLVAQFSLASEEATTIWIRYRSHGDTSLPIRIETETSFIASTHANTAKFFIFYAVILVFLAMSVIAFLLQKRFIFITYFFYAASVFLYVLHRDGYTFQYLWPNHPAFNNFASLPLACALTFFAALFTRSYLLTWKRYPLSDKLLLAIMLGGFSLVAGVLFIAESKLKLFAYFYVLIASASFLGIGCYAWRREGRRIRYFVAGWFGIVLSSIAVTCITLFGLDVSRSAMLDIIRLAMVFDASMMGMAVLEGINTIRRQRDASLREQLSMAQINLGLHSRLDSLEKRYRETQRVAEDRGRILADATHDIRQPLFSLRASIQESINKNTISAARLKDIDASFTYLEGLVDEYMESALTGTENKSHPLPEEEPNTSLSMIISSMNEMFAEEALSKNLQLRTVTSRRTMPVSAMTLLRIVANLTSNAIKYTTSGAVLIGCRLRNGQPGIEVYDTGPGMSSMEVDHILDRKARGAYSDAHQDGKGLGLDIVARLAEENNLLLTITSHPGKGSCFRLTPKTGMTDH
ncbi:sensor histidine kinase [Marinicaulis aureus]|uniref:histidine kinase n=1 Tax=Hyphococcus aureus TaxID=2666033 RepID=A0ABW1KUE2_9PROT